MALLTTQNVSGGAAVTTAAATGGGDTIEVGAAAGGWGLSPIFLYATISTTATTITLAGTAYGPYTSQTVLLPVPSKSMSDTTTATITYSQVTGVAVGAVELGPALD